MDNVNKMVNLTSIGKPDIMSEIDDIKLLLEMNKAEIKGFNLINMEDNILLSSD